MSFIVTASGREVSREFPLQSDFCMEDIAHALALTNRFQGHTARPYSVAEHSLLVLKIARDTLGLDVHGQMYALMHDAHEAYTGDQSSPSKVVIGGAWRAFETRFQHLVSMRFGFHRGMVAYHEEVKQADLLALALERQQLMPSHRPDGHPCQAWPVLADIHTRPEVLGVDLQDPGRESMTWQQWRDAFLQAACDLEVARMRTTTFDRKAA